MDRLITLAVFDNNFDVRYNLLKDMLDEAEINYIISNQNARTIKPMPYTTPSNMSIEIKVYKNKLEEAVKILESIN